MFISIFDKSASKNQVIQFNGLAILDDICLSCKTTEDLAGNYELEATFIIDDTEKYKYIEEEAILKVEMDYGDEIFRIAHLNPSSNEIEVYARQITIADTLDIFLEDVRPANLNGQGAISYMLANSNEYKANKQYAKDLQVFSDITKNNTAYYQNMNLYQAIHDCDQSFENRWGNCEIQRRGYRVDLNSKIGQNRGFQVRSKKNLEGFEYNTNVDNVITRIKPQGYNGITINGYVDSPLISNYPKVKTKVIKYDDIRVKDENNSEGYNTLAEAQAELIRRAKLEYTANHLDELKGEYRVSFIPLEQTEEYKDFAILERCYMGDTVQVIEQKLGINISVRVVRKRYNVLTQRVIELELSNYDLSANKIPTIGEIAKELNSIPNSNDILNDAKANASAMIKAGLKDSYVLVRENEILIMNTKDINTATKVWKWNNGGLGYSSTGYKGDFGLAITQDGAIVADFITTGVLNANLIKTGVLQSLDGSVSINLSNGAFTLGGGSNVATHTKDYSEWKNNDGSVTRVDVEGFYNKVGTNKREYHHLNYSKTGQVELPSNIGSITIPIALPNEFKGKNFEVMQGISDVWSRLFPNAISSFGISVLNKNITNATFDLKISCTAVALNYVANSANGYKVINTDSTFNIVVDYFFSIIA